MQINHEPTTLYLDGLEVYLWRDKKSGRLVLELDDIQIKERDLHPDGTPKISLKYGGETQDLQPGFRLSKPYRRV